MSVPFVYFNSDTSCVDFFFSPFTASHRFDYYCNVFMQAVKETGNKFRETILALGGGKAPLEVRKYI